MSAVPGLARLAPIVAASAVLTLALWGSHHVTAQVPVSADGWYTWQVPAIDQAPGWCCFDWDGGKGQHATCDLDSDHGYHDDTKTAGGAPDRVQIYVLIRDKKWHSVRALRPGCPVTAASQINDLGTLDARSSVHALAPLVTPRTPLSGSALAAIAVHRGIHARDILVKTAHDTLSFANRKDAVFWMGKVRSADTAGPLQQIMFEDDSAKLRAHAAFALAQSPLPEKAAALIRLGRDDDAAHVRAQAWFWLAQTGATDSEAAIGQAVRSDRDHKVREQAVFALSQLPEGRDVAALIGLLEDRSLDKGVRENALMWLAQSESSQAFAYLSRILASDKP